MKIGDKLKRSGKPHDGRAPDYDDWQLNGDLLFWYEPLQRKIEISSMGIRVSEESLKEQLKKAHTEERSDFPFAVYRQPVFRYPVYQKFHGKKYGGAGF